MNDKYTTRYTLLERAKNQNDEVAWEEFIETYKNYIYFIIRAMDINQHDCEDILQQIIVKMWQKLPEYVYTPGTSKFRYWVSLITKNQVISFIRKQQTISKKMEKMQQQAMVEYLDSIRLPDIDLIAEQEWRAFVTNLAMERVKRNSDKRSFSAFEMYSDGVIVPDIFSNTDVIDGIALVI